MKKNVYIRNRDLVSGYLIFSKFNFLGVSVFNYLVII